MQFKLMKDKDGNPTDSVIQMTDEDGVVWGVPNDPENRHWKKYQEWLALGNEPDPAD
jgi:hypothetical protein